MEFCGRVAEWLKALAWKAGERIKPFREFESHPFRHYSNKNILITFSTTVI